MSEGFSYIIIEDQERILLDHKKTITRAMTASDLPPGAIYSFETHDDAQLHLLTVQKPPVLFMSDANTPGNAKWTDSYRAALQLTSPFFLIAATTIQKITDEFSMRLVQKYIHTRLPPDMAYFENLEKNFFYIDKSKYDNLGFIALAKLHLPSLL